jgi:hypothetical protein
VVGNEIRWLDDDPTAGDQPDVVQLGGRGPLWSGHRRWLFALAALAIVIGLLVAFRPHDPKRAASASSSASPSTSTSRSAPPPTFSPSPTPVIADPNAVTTVSGGSPLLDAAPSWVLFAHGANSIFRIQLATGQVISSPIPLLSSDGQSALIAGPDQVIVQTVDSVPGFSIPDGRPAVALPAAFPQGATALPGPDTSHLWVSNVDVTAMTLVGFDGTPTGTTLKVPAQGSTPISDGAGYLLFYAIGGVYELRPNGISRITTGDLIATGPTAFLTNECDAQFHCSTIAINRATGARHTLGPTTHQYGLVGVISPDGSTAAVLTADNNNTAAQIHLVNLATGADWATPIAIDPSFSYEDGLFVWSPDSKWLFATNGVGRIYTVNPAAKKVTELGPNLGPVSQLALRTS